MPNSILVKYVMSPAFHWVQPDATVEHAAFTMHAKDIGFLPVIEDTQIIGTITDRDIAIRIVGLGIDVTKARVRDCMSSKVYYCYDDQPVNEVCKNMSEMKVSRFPVVNRAKRLVGIVSYADLSSSASPRVFAKGQQELKSVLPPHKAEGE